MHPEYDSLKSSRSPVDERDILTPLISFHALRKSMRIIEDMLLYYFPLHGLNFKDFFRVMPMMIFVEAATYQTDEENELNLDSMQRLLIGKRIVTALGFNDEALETELQRGILYWRSERRLLAGEAFEETDLAALNRLKCSDYRGLHRLLFRLLDKPYDEELLDLSWIAEQTGEIEDDLLQYHDDVKRGVYNTYHMFVKLYGKAAPDRLGAYLDELYRELAQREAQLAATRPELAERWQHVQNAYSAQNPCPAIPEPILDRESIPSPASESNPLDNILELQTCISYKALTKALVIVEEIVRYYFPLHGLTEESAFDYLCVLIYAEAMLYQIDEEYEAHIGDPQFISQHTQTLRQILSMRGLYDEKLEMELQNGLELCRLERRVCSGGSCTEAEIIEAMHYKCADYRFLHRLLFLLTGKKYNESLITLCSLVEERGEIEHDLRQYHDDIERNVYNSYRMLVKLHGKHAPKRMREYLDRLDRKIEQTALKLALTHPLLIAKGKALQEAYYQEQPEPAIPEPVIE